MPRRWWTLLLRSCLVVVILVSAAVVHEAGHVLAGLAVGRHLDEVGVMPGVRLYPRLGRVPWDGWIAYVSQSQAAPASRRADGFCNLMGSGTTALVAYLAMAALRLTRPRGLWCFFLVAIAATFGGDIIGYGLLPRLGLRHAVFLGGNTAEPRLGAIAMGVPGGIFDAILAVHAAILGWVLVAAVVRRPVPATN